MTPTEWEITTRGLLEKLRRHFYFSGLDSDRIEIVKEFIRLAKEEWEMSEGHDKL